MTPDRDPRNDPRQGDVVTKEGKRGLPIVRTVMRRDGNQVYFRSVEGGSTKSCWLTTWMDWCYGADVEDVSENDQPTNEGQEMAKEMAGEVSEGFVEEQQHQPRRRRRGDR